MGQAIGFFMILIYALFAEGVLETLGGLPFMAISTVVLLVSYCLITTEY